MAKRAVDLEALVGGADRISRDVPASTVRLTTDRSGNGAGVVVSPDGIIVSCAHVATEPSVHVRFSTGEEALGNVTLRDPERDLAVVRVSEEIGAYLNLGSSDKLHPGQLVFSIGYPASGSPALAMGVIHALANERNHWPMIVSDIRLAPGYSGGPMVNSEGDLIGVNVMVSGGLGLAVPAQDIKRILKVESLPRLGIGARPVTVTSGNRQSTRRMLVTAVVTNSPAGRAGLTIGDVIVSANERPVERTIDLWDGLASAAADLSLEVLRGGQKVRASIPLVASGAARMGEAA